MTPRGTMALACSGFLALGIILASLGPALPDLARATGAPLAALGGLLSLIFIGGLVAQLFSGPLTDRFGPRRTLTAGLFLLALGTTGIALSKVLWLTFAFAGVLGLGHGTLGVSFSLLIARTFPARTVPALNLLNLFYGIGAIVGPAFASYLIRSVGSGVPTLWLGVAVVAVALPFGFRLPNQADGTSSKAPSSPIGSILRMPAFWLAGALLLTYVGTESSVAAWTTTYLQAVAGQPQATGALLTSGFWAAVTLGRLVVTFVGGRIKPATLLFVTLSGGAAGGILLASSGTSPVLIGTAILLLGLSFAPVYPTGIALTTSLFPGSGTATSLVAAMASTGGATIPALQGFVQDAAGAYQGMLVVTVGTLLMAFLSLALKRAAHRN